MMKTYYLDQDCRIHFEQDKDGTLLPWTDEDGMFDGKCESYIRGFRVVPKGCTWTRHDGAMFHGMMVAPAVEFGILTTAQEDKVKADKKTLALSQAGADLVKVNCQTTGNAPAADSGIFVAGVPEWEPGKAYAANDLFAYDGTMGFVKQAHTSQEVWLPFTAGTEALYGARPAPDENGVYPWAYNMAAVAGMRVKDPDDGAVYTCIQDNPTLLYKPHMLAAHFVKE